MSQSALHSIGDFDLLHDDASITEYVQPYCVALNHSGTRLGVGTEQGFRVFSLVTVPSPAAASSGANPSADVNPRAQLPRNVRSAVPATAAPKTKEAPVPVVHWVEAFRYPPLPDDDGGYTDDEDDEDGFVWLPADPPKDEGKLASSSPALGRTNDFPESPTVAAACGVGTMAFLSDTQVVCGPGGERPICRLNAVLFFSGPSKLAEIAFSDAVRQICLSSAFVLALTQTSLEIRDYDGNLLYHAAAYGGMLPSAPSPVAFQPLQRLIAYPTAKVYPFAGAASTAFIPNSSLDFERAGLDPHHSFSGSATAGFGFSVLHFPDRLASSLFTAGTGNATGGLRKGLEETITGATDAAFDASILATVPEAHKTHLSSLSFNVDGTLIATSSERGTLLRVWATNRSGKGQLVKELRIGSVPHPSSSIQTCFIGTLYLCCLHGMKVKVFYVGLDKDDNSNHDRTQFWHEQNQRNQQSRFSHLGYLSTYFQSEWAVTECELPSSQVPQAILLQQLSRQDRQRSQYSVSPSAAGSSEGLLASGGGVASLLATTSIGAFTALRSSWYFGSPSNQGQAVGATPSPPPPAPTTGSWLGGFFGSYQALPAPKQEGGSSPEATTPNGVTPTSSRQTATTTTTTAPHSVVTHFVPSTTEDLSAIWWAQPTARQWQLDQDTRRNSASATSSAQISSVNAATSFFVSNCDGSLIQMRFHPRDGTITAVPMPAATFRIAKAKQQKQQPQQRVGKAGLTPPPSLI